MSDSKSVTIFTKNGQISIPMEEINRIISERNGIKSKIFKTSDASRRASREYYRKKKSNSDFVADKNKRSKDYYEKKREEKNLKEDSELFNNIATLDEQFIESQLIQDRASAAITI